MKISQLPQEVKEKALKNQRNEDISWDKKTDNLQAAFDWEDSEEGDIYWEKWDYKEWEELIKKEEIKKTKTQIYTIEVITDENGMQEVHRTNDGFNPMELLGMMKFVLMEIEGSIKPTKITRNVVKK